MKTESYVNVLGFYVLDPKSSICVALLKRGSSCYYKIYCERKEEKAIISRSILTIRRIRTARSVAAWLRTHRNLNSVEPQLRSFPVASDFNKCIALFVSEAPLKDS